MSQLQTSNDTEIREPTQDDIFKNLRSGYLTRVIYADQSIVLLRSEQMDRTESGHIHNALSTTAFINQQKFGNLRYTTNENTSIPKANQITSIQEAENIIDTEDITTLPDPNTKTNTETSINTQNENNSAQSKPTTTAEPENWSKIPLVGEKIESRLHENGYTTVVDVEEATINELQKIEGLGERSAANLMAYVSGKDLRELFVENSQTQKENSTKEKPTSNTPTTRENWSEIKQIGDSIAGKLHDAGYNTKEDIRNAERDDLEEIDQLGKIAIENIITYSST